MNTRAACGLLVPWLHLIALATAAAVTTGKPQSSAASTRIAVINLSNFHHEVYPVFHYAFEKAGYDVTTFATNGDEYLMKDVTKNWMFNAQNIADISTDICRFDILVFTSIEYEDDFR